MIEELKIEKTINKTFANLPVPQDKIKNLKKNLETYKNGSQQEQNGNEEFYKNLISDFLKNTWYKDTNLINTYHQSNKLSVDLAIYSGKGNDSKIAVLIEVKSPKNKDEMFSIENPNCKALQECVYYFLKESVINENKEIKNIIITNYDDFYIFSAKDLSRFFVKELGEDIKKHSTGLLTDNTTDYFYQNCAKPAIDEWLKKETIKVTHFSPKEFYDKEDTDIIPLYKIFSPEHLLGKPFANDSNSLDKKFYAELLHIIGLEEIKEGSKKLIKRKSEEKRDSASLLESSIFQLEERIFDGEERFEIALRLCVMWINRLLFLKLVESQLLSYQNSNTNYKFLTIETIPNFSELDILFFKVLGRKTDERDKNLKEKYKFVPYLNSSLFEPCEEESLLRIRGLQNNQMKIFGQTVLKDNNGKKAKGKRETLAYIFDFLDSYNFASDVNRSIVETNKTLINASVLGLIFEKLNGYKDGSFFTPGFITEYMAKETIERVVIQKFNEVKKWKCKSLSEVREKINLADNRDEASEIIDSLKICDPAVGSGHFLVSVLNRILYIKSYLNILHYTDGELLLNSEWEFSIENDDLSVFDSKGRIFTYSLGNKSLQRLQEAIFNEKRQIIENCLFGVDINPASVYICRLRLWIELLKNAYYTKESNYTQLETLPNIDINIKCGNSLISKYPIQIGTSFVDYVKSDATKSKEFKELLLNYKNEVSRYKRENNKEIKYKVNNKINAIKQNISGIIQYELFDEEKNKQAIEDDFFRNSMEWMIEFPEILDTNGKLLGFDAVIGNPPYGIFNKKQNKKISLTTEDIAINLIKKRYYEADEGMINAAKVFYALGFRLMSENGYMCMIIPFGILADTSSIKIRKKIFEQHSFIRIDAFPERDSTNRRVFDDAKMSTAILLTSNKKMDSKTSIGVSFEKTIPLDRSDFSKSDIASFSPDMMQIPICNREAFDFLMKMRSRKDLSRFGEIAPTITGELDMTQGKEYLTTDTSKTMLVKGAQISRFIFKTKSEDISQGEIEYVNTENFYKKCSKEKQEQIKHRRIAMQGLSGINERVRLKGVIVPENFILANSSNFLKHQTFYSLQLLLGLFNSKLLNFIFKATSTSSNVNGYEVDSLPFPRLTNNNVIQQQKIITLVDKILSIKREVQDSDTSSIEHEIDLLVYQLYGLTEDEISIIENS